MEKNVAMVSHAKVLCWTYGPYCITTVGPTSGTTITWKPTSMPIITSCPPCMHIITICLPKPMLPMGFAAGPGPRPASWKHLDFKVAKKPATAYTVDATLLPNSVDHHQIFAVLARQYLLVLLLSQSHVTAAVYCSVKFALIL